MRFRLTISRKFFGVLAVLAPLVVAVALAGVGGVASVKSDLDRVFADNVRVSRVSTRLGAALARSDEIALRLGADTNPAERRALNATLDQSVIPAVDSGLVELQALHANDGPAERALVARLAQGWSQFLVLRDGGVLSANRSPASVVSSADGVSRQITGIFDPLNGITQGEAAFEGLQVQRASARAGRTSQESRLLIWASTIAALALGVGSVLLLTRNVVPRIRRYAQFASAVAGGDLGDRMNPQGSDELAILGRALDEMVTRRAVGAKHHEIQSEFIETLQVTDSEEVAHDLLRRQVTRSIPGSSVVVLNRNNSQDRLVPTTALDPSSPLNRTLVNARPRSCMAVLFARTHAEDPDRETLTNCELCGRTGSRATCEPLLVGGEVIGSVLVSHGGPLDEQETAALQDSVAQSAPVLANLRNLALAEFRASTDGLTGLSNKRAVQELIKRMAAQASRSDTPLSAIMLDLDHFKQINDTLGHELGDNVLAAVGAVLADTVRVSDFVGRNGGEEFIVLLPDTDSDHAIVAAEKIRVAIDAVTVSGVQRDITASLGIATMPDHAGDGDQLVRSADRALYVAKNNGRNRAEIAATGHPDQAEPQTDGPPILLAAGGA